MAAQVPLRLSGRHAFGAIPPLSRARLARPSGSATQNAAMNFTRLVVGTPSAPSSADCSPPPICGMALRKHACFFRPRNTVRTTRDTGSDENALSNAQRASVRDLLLDIPINAEGLIELCNLGWLDPEQFRDRRAAADAVIELTNAAIALRLRPSM